MGAHHDTQDHGADHGHGSHASYIKGFILSVVLTAIPFAVVMAGGFENRLLTVALIVGFAVVQILVHMVYFLHMTAKHEEGWTMMSTLFTLIVVVIMLAGSIWVMYHMNTNMMPQMTPEAMQGFGS